MNPRQGRDDVDGRFSLAGTVLGVTVIVAALTFGSRLTRLTSTPRLYGVSCDAEILNGNGSAAVHATIPVLPRPLHHRDPVPARNRHSPPCWRCSASSTRPAASST
jgi:hypothetical protein